ncbi:hypothetical protein PHBOTO_003906 [Pseudozyma hubeiensis]|nr:hypothetical protein PHBOTO_003906 [Pseudozyma hubeiensis]
MPVHLALKRTTIYRGGEKLDPSIATLDEVDHKLCSSNVFSRVLQGNRFLKSSNSILRSLNKLKPSKNRSQDSPNFKVYQEKYTDIIDTFCLIDYNVLPVEGGDPFSQFKLVNRLGKEKFPRTPLQIRIHSLRHDISTLSELLRRDLCTNLRPENVIALSYESIMQRFRLVRAVQNLYAEHAIMLAPNDDAFLWRDCKICARYDPEIIRFCRDFYRLLLRMFHGERNKPISCRFFTSAVEMSDAELDGDL